MVRAEDDEAPPGAQQRDTDAHEAEGTSPYMDPDADAPGLDRRSFVKNAIWGATLGLAGASTFGFIRQVAPNPDTTLRTIPYVGAMAGPSSPAPRGLALVPLTVDGDGAIRGRPEVDGTNILDWYRYCGHESNPALRTGPADDRMRYAVPADKLEVLGAQAEEVYWFLDRIGEPLNVDHWKDLATGTGAAVRWRSEDVAAQHNVTAIVIKLEPDQVEHPRGFDLDAFMLRDHGLIAFTSYCTHLCCVPGFKEDVSGYAERKGVWDQIFCTCHGSRFDPTILREYSFQLREPGEDTAH